MNDIINNIPQLDGDYIRYQLKRLERDEIKRTAIVRTSYRNPDDLILCMQNDIILALYYRQQKQE
ncbi:MULTISPECIES: hypothetical protein [Vibrio]|uniref:hypothetical protein n=1 Tax=Vibrio TaxID=662 RepID=UPI001CDC3AFB|nr:MULTISPECIES: hypothetical protein [Vibrio]MCA2487227.1 hypothetical protein [Vibrio alginolyticus]MDW1779961.1 hypothetical protein [Vibrio sp. Vb2134]MDW2084329.1 hypothetical protein [Vibrio sp. 2134-1]